MKKRYYITQYSAWWSLSSNDFISLLREIKKEGGYDLSKFKQLKNRPACTYMYDGNPYPKINNIEIVECLDWSASDFKNYYSKEWEKAGLNI